MDHHRYPYDRACGQVQALHAPGLSLNFYANYYIMVASITTLGYAALAFILFWIGK